VAAGRSLAWRPDFSSTKAFSEPEECYSITILNSQSRWRQHDTGISHGNVVIARMKRRPMCAAFELRSFFAYSKNHHSAFSHKKMTSLLESFAFSSKGMMFLAAS
jgi:hypothetical protein